MKISMLLDVTREEFYQLLLESFVGEYNFFSGTQLETKEIIEKISYEKTIPSKLGTEKPVIVTVNRMLNGKLFELKIHSGLSTDICTYRIDNCDSNIYIEYEEIHQTEKTIDNISYSIMSFVYGFIGKKRHKKMLKQMEAHILSNR